MVRQSVTQNQLRRSSAPIIPSSSSFATSVRAASYFSADSNNQPTDVGDNLGGRLFIHLTLQKCPISSGCMPRGLVEQFLVLVRSQNLRGQITPVFRFCSTCAWLD